MSKLNSALALSCLILTGGLVAMSHFASAEPQKTVCVLQPYDQGVNPDSVNASFAVLRHYNVTAIYIGLVHELEDKTHKGCDVVLQFAMMNNKYGTGMPDTNEKFIPYSISGNTITVFTSTIPVTPNTQVGGSVTIPMTNPVCWAEAHATYHLKLGQTTRMVCDPYRGMNQNDANPSLPIDKIENALNDALKAIGI